jgi:hypothetical protein
MAETGQLAARAGWEKQEEGHISRGVIAPN